MLSVLQQQQSILMDGFIKQDRKKFKLFFYNKEMLINRSNQEHYDARKQSLIQQILSYNKRIQQYQKLQKQLKNISTTIDQTELSVNIKQSGALYKNSSSKSLTTSKNKLNTQQSNSVIKKERNMERRVSSSKKIKIYELQKKLSRLNKEHNQKFSEFISKKREHQVTLETIKQILDSIDKQQMRTDDLIKQNDSYVQKLQSVNNDNIKTKNQFQKVLQRKQIYQYQKQSLLKKIQLKKKTLSKLKNQLKQNIKNNQFSLFQAYNQQEQEDRLSNQQTYRTERQKRVNKEDSKDLTYSEITYKYDTSKRINFQGVQYEIIESNNSLQQSYYQNPHQNLTTVIHHSAVSQNPLYKPQSTGYRGQIPLKQIPLQQKNNMFQILQDKMQLLQNQNSKLNQQIYRIKKQMLQIQTQTKHHKTNSNLLKSKINNLNKFINRQKINQLKNLQKIEVIRNKLSSKQGLRGEIRGRLGTKVEQEGLVKILNLTINKDLQNLREKVNCLIVYRNMLCGQMIIKT